MICHSDESCCGSGQLLSGRHAAHRAAEKYAMLCAQVAMSATSAITP